MDTSGEQKKVYIENLGHSTFIVKKDGLKILTDPFLTDSAGSIKRVLPPPVSAEEIFPDMF